MQAKHTGLLIQYGWYQTHRERHRGKGWEKVKADRNDAATSQRAPRTASSHQQLERCWGQVASEPLEGTKPAQTSGFFCCLKASRLCYFVIQPSAANIPA